MIELRNVSVAFDDTTVVRDVTLELARAETTVLLGRSGSGKTTLLKLINAMLMPSEGTVIVDGTATDQHDPIALRRSIGYVIQEAGLLPHYTVRRNIGLVPELCEWQGERIDKRVDELMQLVGLPPLDFADRYPHQLSGGQRQRVGVARALAANPPILLCDEPFGALDPITRAELQSEFRALADRLDKTIVFVTHDVREALLIGHRIILLGEGNVLVDASPTEFRQSNNLEARAFLASITEPA